MKQTDFSKTYEPISNAPVVEAVLSINVQNESEWDKESLLAKLKESLPKFTFQSVSNFTQELVFEPPSKETKTNFTETWTGFLSISEDKKTLVAFDRNFFRLNQLAPYDCWDSFFAIALKYFEIYKGLIDIERTKIVSLGVRFINHIPFSDGSNLGDYLENGPREIEGLSIIYGGFLHQEIVRLTDMPYFCRISKLIQEDKTPDGVRPLIVIDIDCATNQYLHLDFENFKEHFGKLRAFKNAMFYGSINREKLRRHYEH